jgi:hypothetical protein
MEIQMSNVDNDRDDNVIAIRYEYIDGVGKWYPANAQAERLAQIAGTKTFALDKILSLAPETGFSIRMEPRLSETDTAPSAVPSTSNDLPFE